MAPIIFLAWITGVLGMFSYISVTNVKFIRTLRASSRSIASTDIPHYLELCQLLAIKKPLPVSICKNIRSPFLLGIFRPQIILTDTILNDDTALKHVLLHELCHYTQKDHIITLLKNICCIIYWFNPLIWVAASASRNDSELSCDYRVTKYLNTKESLDYAHTLVSMLRTTLNDNTMHLKTNILSDKSLIKKRIHMIVKRPKTLKSTSILIGLLIIPIILTTLTAASTATNDNSEEVTGIFNAPKNPMVAK